MKIRREVMAFALEMERVLQENDHKGGWEGMDPFDLLDRIGDECDELTVAIENYEEDRGPENLRSLAIRKEAVDIANFCMMVADQYGGLDVMGVDVLEMPQPKEEKKPPKVNETSPDDNEFNNNQKEQSRVFRIGHGRDKLPGT